jgi:electron transport complex protein RnfD
MKFSTAVPPFLGSDNTVKRVMAQVLLALLPAILLTAWLLSAGVLIQLTLAIVTALVAEGSVFLLRKKPIKQGLSDLSAVVTAVLLALSVPVLAPWWVVVNGTLFALLIGKHVYGGLGHNPFNPAMVGYAFLLISFPQPMTAWLAFDAPPLSFIDSGRGIFSEHFSVSVDALTRATPLDTLKTQLRLAQPIAQIQTLPVFGWLAGKTYQWLAVSYLIGGLWLLKRQVISWQIPVALLGSLSVLALIGFLYNNQQFSSPVFHFFAGSTCFGAFFIATDPVTAATSPRGRLIYGGLIGLLLYAIRTWGGYPDSMAFAVLLANLAVPSIDYFTKPRVYGQPR